MNGFDLMWRERGGAIWMNFLGRE